MCGAGAALKAALKAHQGLQEQSLEDHVHR